jgi:putative hydrolase of the HAD superfamily
MTEAPLAPPVGPVLAGLRALLLDVGGVLVVPRPELLAGVVGPYGGCTDETAVIRAHYRALADADGDDRFDWPTYHDRLLVACGVPAADRPACAAAMADLVRSTPDIWAHPLPGVAAALRDLAGRVTLGVVSNSDGSARGLLAGLGLCQLGGGPGAPLAVVVDSAVVGVEKPDPRIFQGALDALGLPAEQVGYLGDTRAFDVRGARAAGLRPIHVDPYGFCPADDHAHVTGLADL